MDEQNIPEQEQTPIELPTESENIPEREPVKNPGDVELEEKEKRHEKKRAAEEKIKEIDWDKIATVDDLKAVVKSLFEIVM